MSASPGFSAYDADADYAALDEHARAILDCWFGAPGSASSGLERTDLQEDQISEVAYSAA